MTGVLESLTVLIEKVKNILNFFGADDDEDDGVQTVGCDGVIGSDRRLDRCGVCGGNNSTCHVISGIFTRTRLPPGYNRVTSVPRGACNINITELVYSPNHLGK